MGQVGKAEPQVGSQPSKGEGGARGGAARESRAGGQLGRGRACSAPWRFPARGP